jgi:carbohydrate kinase (thermoresistant glucokinase family)
MDDARAKLAAVVVMGVSGAGKSTVGRIIAGRLDCEFRDADSFHPKANIEKMSRGEPLTDADRLPWLRAIAADIAAASAAGEPVVLACSALKRSYRELLRDAAERVHLVHLSGSEALIQGRMAARDDHFMPPALLPSQFRTLEPPVDAEQPIVIDIAAPPEVIVTRICAAIGHPPPHGPR